MRHLKPAFVVILAGVVAALHLPKLIPALPVLQQELGLSLVQAGFLLSTVQLAGMSLGLVIGLAADGLGLRRSMVAGLVTLTLASAAGGFAHGAKMLLVLRVIEGLGFLLAVTPAPGLIRQLVTPVRLGKLLGLWSAYMPFATALALLTGPWVILHLGWQVMWWLLAALSGVLAVWVWRVVPADLQPRGKSAPTPRDHAWARVMSTLSRRGPWLVALCFAVYACQWLAVIGFLPTIYAQAGIAVGVSAGLTALAAAVNIAGNVVSGRLMGAGKAPQQLLYVGYGVMAVSALFAYVDLTPWVGNGSGSGIGFLIQYAAVLVFSMVGGVIPGTLFALAVKLAPSESTVSTTIGWMQQWSAIGQFFGPPLVALVASRMGGWQWTWVVTGIFAMAGMLLARQLANLTNEPLHR
jgi:MFS transporter, CP family, cyanate transporter